MGLMLEGINAEGILRSGRFSSLASYQAPPSFRAIISRMTFDPHVDKLSGGGASLVPSRIALTRGKIRLVTLGTEIGARTTHGMWNCE